MTVKFKYNSYVEYFLKIYSSVYITGDGNWEVDELDLLEQYSNSELNLDDFIKKYFYEDLEIDSDSIEFNEDDIKELTNFIEEHDIEKYES